MKTKILSLLAALLLGTTAAWAVPAYPYPIQYKHPDGSLLTIVLKGDERVSWATSPDGYSLLLNKDGFYEYAVKNGAGDLNLSGVRVRNENERTGAEIALLKNLSKDLRYSREQVNLLKRIWEIQTPPAIQKSSAAPNNEKQVSAATGNVHAPLILVGFQGKPFTKTKADFETLLNQPDYTAGGTIPGSVYDYFQAASYGQLNYQVDIFGPYTLDHAISYYDDKSDGDPRAMAYEAAVQAHNDGCNFSNYDRDNDGLVDGLHIIFAGYDQAAGAPAGNAIWSHAWALFENYQLRLDGKWVYRYSCSTELRGTSGTNITYIGVIAHELGHVFGLPDLYDTDYEQSGGKSIDLGPWDIMASGSWNDDGRTPAFHSAWCRDYLGWTPAVKLTAPADIVLPNPAEQGAAYRINTQTPNEYFLIENRQKQGWDAYTPSSGMLIYHVDENYPGWDNNCANCTPSHRGLYVKQAGGGAGSDQSNRSNDPYPSSGNTGFTDLSTPNSKSWAGANTEKPITNITHNTTMRTVSFRFMDLLPPVTALEALVTGRKVTLSWIAPDEENLTGYIIYRDNNPVYTIPNKTITSFTQDNVPNGDYNYCVAALYNSTESAKVCTEIAVRDNFYEAAIAPASVHLDFVQSPDYPWIAGEDYVMSSNQNRDNTDSWFTTTISHPYDMISLSFNWSVNSEPDYDFLRFYINDQLREEISGSYNLNFTTKNYKFTPGTYTLKWEYHKDQNTSHDIDAGYISHIKVTYETFSNIKENKPAGSTVSVSDGRAIIHTEAGNAVAIYSIDGRKIKDFRTTNSLTSVPLATGIYIVRINNETFRIMVY